MHSPFYLIYILSAASILGSLPPDKVGGTAPGEPAPSSPETRIEFLDPGTFRVTLSFDLDRVAVSREKGLDPVRLEMENCRLEGRPGQPLLPRYYLRVPVPPAARFAGLRVFGASYLTIPGRYRLPPAPASASPGAARRADAEETAVCLGSRTVRGKKYLLFRITPLHYLPEEGKLRLYPDLRFTVTLKSAPLLPFSRSARLPSPRAG